MDIVDLGTLPKSEAVYSDFLLQVREKLEMDHAAYAGLNPAAGAIHGYVTYSDEWKLHYQEQGFHMIDPTLHMSQRSIAPVDWSRLERSSDFRRVFRDAHDFGIGDQGLTIPVRGPYGDVGLLSVTRECSTDEWHKLVRHTLGDLQSLAVHIHDTVMSSDMLGRVLYHPSLSTREAEILQWVAAGKSQQDIGDILSISHRTVEVHLRSSREKLCALTTAQAVGRAVGLGLIYPG
ncbi:LuxR family transcriptional regulator [Ruegeria pomeroyi]|uniref:LuxR family transcriptional regulator n=1 Tax=Ruegeria alba TaxID=2916756 RepID=A0ABS9P424_9RHOB|nr:LuxR family transcriptional regulator [Ruegeria alba]MCE8527531.1 LuxR family transcriptional regulator [Ruegeria pomeroyi]MCE8535694.1 LuxR family transcriptional regulator [Ruegeria pomeroyi]MCE8546066.1 LuxR family transcriptional regulator [Ruegeria pomeroyi]MCG6560515.1 LuxR family transcriptional regulator [Ruegeria alba]